MLARRASSLLPGNRPLLLCDTSALCHSLPARFITTCARPIRLSGIRAVPPAAAAAPVSCKTTVFFESRRSLAFSIPQEEPDLTIKFRIHARLRMKTGKYAAAALRALPEPRCPGIIQGAKLPPLLIDMDQREVQLRYNDGCFKNRIYDLVIEGLDQPVKAFAQTLTYDPLTLEVRNVSFMRYDEGREYEVPIPVKVANTQDNVAMKKGALLIPLQREVRCFFKAIKGENMPPYFVFDARHSPVNTIIRSSHLTYPPTTKPIPKHRDVPLFSITGRGRGGGDDPEDAPAAPAAAAKAAPAAEKKDDKKK